MSPEMKLTHSASLGGNSDSTPMKGKALLGKLTSRKILWTFGEAMVDRSGWKLPKGEMVPL